MKKLLIGISALIVATPLVAGAQTTRPGDKPATDTTTKPRDTRPADTRPADTRPAWKAEGNVVETRDLIGTRIKNAEGKDIGEIDSLVIDPQSGRISYVVVGLGGFLGVGERKVVVPWSELKMPRHGWSQASHREGRRS